MIKIVRSFPVPKQFDAITLWPVIFVRKSFRDKSVISKGVWFKKNGGWFHGQDGKILNVEYVLNASHQRLLRHEQCHLRQQARLLVIGFYILYGLMFLWNYIIRCQPYMTAYSNIYFERKAREAETK